MHCIFIDLVFLLSCVFRLQNSLYFCVFKYARAVKQKVWNEAENRERDWGETQNSLYFCVFKYARAVKQKVWNEAENRERDWGETLKILTVRFAYVIFVRITRFSQPRAIPIG